MLATKEKISILKTEYLRLKELDKHFKSFWLYLENLMDTKRAREEVEQKKVIPQEKLFKKLGL